MRTTTGEGSKSPVGAFPLAKAEIGNPQEATSFFNPLAFHVSPH